MNLRLLPKLRLLAKCIHDKALNPELMMECDLIAHSIWRHLSLVLGARPTKRPRRTVLPNNLHPTLEDMWCRLRRPFLKLTRRAREVRPTSCQLPAVPLAIRSGHLFPLAKALNSETCSCFPTDLRGRTFQREPPLSQHSCHCARCAMVAKHVKSAATSAGEQREGKGQEEAAAKQEMERLRVELGHPQWSNEGTPSEDPNMASRVTPLRKGQT